MADLPAEMERCHREASPALGTIALCLAARRARRSEILPQVDRAIAALQRLRSLLVGDNETVHNGEDDVRT